MDNVLFFLIGAIIGYAISATLTRANKPKYLLRTRDNVAGWGGKGYFVSKYSAGVDIARNIGEAKKFESMWEAAKYNQNELEDKFEIIPLTN